MCSVDYLVYPCFPICAQGCFGGNKKSDPCVGSPLQGLFYEQEMVMEAVNSMMLSLFLENPLVTFVLFARASSG